MSEQTKTKKFGPDPDQLESMKHIRQSLAIVLALGSIGCAMAAVTAEEAKQLGTTLTALGAEKAANEDGRIPEFTNNPITPPADYKPGSGRYPDPFRDEKPLFSIDAKNMAQYADKLSEGTVALLKRWPSYRIDVYPTHRSATYSKWIGDNTIRNATSARLVADGLGVEGAYGGPPFPIPKSGAEVIWNTFLQPTPVSVGHLSMCILMDAAGGRNVTSISTTYSEYPFYDPDRTSLDGLTFHKKLSYGENARDRGNKTLNWYAIDYSRQDYLAWIYMSGQRRIRPVAGMKYDVAAGNGGYTFDEIGTYSGPPDKYEFKLVGKKEIYVPYNAYRADFGSPEKVMGPKHFNPDALRWELHRVWVVDGTLKPGMSHAQARRTFYADEDSWALLLTDGYDNNGKLSRIGQVFTFPMYEGGISSLFSLSTLFYDMLKEGYAILYYVGDPTMYVKPVPRLPPSETSPEGMAGSGVR